MKEITKQEMRKLLENNVLRNSSKGFVDKSGFVVGYCKTRNKRYIEDKYADIAKTLL